MTAATDCPACEEGYICRQGEGCLLVEVFGSGPNIHDLLVGRTIQALVVRRYDGGFDGAMAALDITTDDGKTVTLYAGSYAIPEEACIYATVS